MRTTGILLAAGLSRRFGGNKLHSRLDGETVLRRSVLNLCGAELDEVIVVLGHEAVQGRTEIEDLAVRVVENPRYQEGMGTSLACGVLAAGPTDGYLIALGDMPFVPSSHFRRLIETASENAPVIVATSRPAGSQEPPIWFSSQLRPELVVLEGDRGARDVVSPHRAQLVTVRAEPVWLRDIDVPET